MIIIELCISACTITAMHIFYIFAMYFTICSIVNCHDMMRIYFLTGTISHGTTKIIDEDGCWDFNDAGLFHVHDVPLFWVDYHSIHSHFLQS